MIAKSDLAQFHDATLTAIEISDDRRCLSLKFRFENSSRKAIKLSGVINFRMVDVTTQNVVSRLLVSLWDDFKPSDIGEWLKWIASFSDTGPYITNQQADDSATKLHGKELGLFVLEPSVGATVAAIFGGIEIALN